MNSVVDTIIAAHASSKAHLPSRILEIRPEESKLVCVGAEGREFTLSRLVGSNVRIGDEVLVPASTGTATADTEIYIRKPSLRLADVYQVKAGYAALPKLDKREEPFVRVQVAAEGERLMDTAAQAMILNWKRSLEDHLESVVNGERGGLSLAAALVGDLLEHLHQSRPDSVAPATYGDPSPLTTEIRHALDGFPSDAAVLTRTAIAGVLCDTSVATASFAIVPKTFVLVGVVGGIGLLAAAVRHIARQHIRNRLAHLSETIRKKWQSLIETATLRVASKAFDSFIDHLQTTARELRAAGTRVGELVEYFHETYEPQWPTGTALWQVVAFGRAEIVSYEALCTARTDRPISTYLERSGKQFLWRRLASPQSDQPPNGWEGQIAEEAAIFTLSACTNIIDLTILAVLSQRPELLEAYQRVWVTASQPYLLTGGYAAVAGVLEAKPGNNGPVLSRLHSGLALQLEHLTTLFTAPGCRLTLTTFMEPTPITDVVTTG